MTNYEESLPDDRDLGSLRAMIKAQDFILRELFDLLNQYAPMWYSEDQHKRLAILLSPTEDVTTASDGRLNQWAAERVIVDAPIAIAARNELKRRRDGQKP